MGDNDNECPKGGDITNFLCDFCAKFSIIPSCKRPECGRKKNKDKYAEYGRFIMGPDGKMYDRLMMNPQMLQDGKIPEEMCQEGMQEQGIQGPGTKEPGMQQRERKDPRIKQSMLQEPDMNENEKKHKNKNSSTDYKNPKDDELHVGYNTL
ncbi:hypothetical protein PVP01_0902700 [Plasmodium vivax]|uniref:Uncharacterized protein n=1 Tax=Plasmodium vivax TaxID=5855 RepID=A0A564ZU95_PLAVI|nr:hypothetical protein PVP01_0902700 [Plasmodium vivax]